MPESCHPRAEIVLVRHGRSSHVVRGWFDLDGVRQWMIAYDAAGITHDFPPPPELLSLARSADVIVSSDLPRAVASGAVLADAREVQASAMFREAPLETPELPFPGLGGIRLPFHGWGVIFGLRWLRASRRRLPPPGVDATVLARAETAADWLVQKANEEGLVLVVTHATFRSVLASALDQRGWRSTGRRSFRAWSAWRLRDSGA